MDVIRFIESVKGLSRGGEVYEYLNTDAAQYDPHIHMDLCKALLHVIYGTTTDVKSIYKETKYLSKTKIFIPRTLFPNGISKISSELLSEDVLNDKYVLEQQEDGILIYIKGTSDEYTEQ